PGLSERAVETVSAPGPKQRDHASAADVDHVLREKMRARIGNARLAPEQRDVRRLAARGPKRAIEPHYVMVGVSTRGRQETHPRARHAGKAKHIVVEPRVTAPVRKAASTERDNLGRPNHARRSNP